MFTYELDPWPMVKYQPILFTFMWVAMWHIVLPGGGNGAIDTLGITPWIIWLITGFTCPPLLLLSWYLIERCSGTWRYRGLWWRLAADIGEFGVLTAFLWARIAFVNPVTDAQVFGWIAISSMAFFLFRMVVRDVFILHAVRKLAAENRAKERRGRD